MDVPHGWSIEEGGKALVRTFSFGDFSEAFAFLTRVALHAEKVDHHPEFTSRWNRVDMRLTSHDAGTITDRDRALALAIESSPEPVRKAVVDTPETFKNRSNPKGLTWGDQSAAVWPLFATGRRSLAR